MANELTTTGGGIHGAEWLTPATLEQGMKLAEMMANCTLVPDHLRKKPGDCLPILVQSLRWRMDPFAVAQATAVVRGKLCYEGKLVHAVLVSMGAIDGRLRYEWSGQGQARKIRVIGRPRGSAEDCAVEGTVAQWATDNGAWKRDPDAMLAYRGARVWARLYCPDAMLGVYTQDEIAHEDIREADGVVVAEPEEARVQSVADEPGPAAEPEPSPEPKPKRQAKAADEPMPAHLELARELWRECGGDTEVITALCQVWGVSQPSGIATNDAHAFALAAQSVRDAIRGVPEGQRAAAAMEAVRRIAAGGVAE